MKKNIFFILFIMLVNWGISQTKTPPNTYKIIELQEEAKRDSYIEAIKNVSMDEYRFYNIRQKVQLVNGPLIELLSIKEVQSLGITVDQKIIDVAKGKSESFKHETILLINIGLGITQIVGEG